MGRIHIKSMILGIGIGIIFTSIVSMIYLAGTQPNAKLSDDEIRSIAKSLGMIEADDILPNGTEKDSSVRNETQDVKKRAKSEEKDINNDSSDNSNNDMDKSRNNDSIDNGQDEATGHQGQLADKSDVPKDVSVSENDEQQTQSTDTVEDNEASDADSNSDSEKKTKTVDTKWKSNGGVIEFLIARGDTTEEIAETLFSSGLIKEKDEFISAISNKNLTRKIQPGTYYIRLGTDLNTIIKIITKT